MTNPRLAPCGSDFFQMGPGCLVAMCHCFGARYRVIIGLSGRSDDVRLEDCYDVKLSLFEKSALATSSENVTFIEFFSLSR